MIDDNNLSISKDEETKKIEKRRKARRKDAEKEGGKEGGNEEEKEEKEGGEKEVVPSRVFAKAGR